jgi:hypothetical protein
MNGAFVPDFQQPMTCSSDSAPITSMCLSIKSPALRRLHRRFEILFNREEHRLGGFVGAPERQESKRHQIAARLAFFLGAYGEGLQGKGAVTVVPTPALEHSG